MNATATDINADEASVTNKAKRRCRVGLVTLLGLVTLVDFVFKKFFLLH